MTVIPHSNAYTSKLKNIVIINPDQMRWDYASCYGHPFIGTTNLDSLAQLGTRFHSAFVASPHCGPSRCSFLTGQYPNEHGVRTYSGTLDPEARMHFRFWEMLAM